MIKRVFCSCACLFLVLGCLGLYASASGVPRPTTVEMDGCCFVTVSGGSLGHVDIYLPVNYQSGYLTLKDGVPFNASGSTVNGYVLNSSGGIRYYIRWSAWSTAEYRPYSGTTTWSTYNITGVEASNVQWLTYEAMAAPSDFSWNLMFLGVLVLGVIVFFIKH